MLINACTGCALPRPVASAARCRACRDTAPPWDACHAACPYELPTDYLVKRFKYAGDRASGRAMAELMWSRAAGFREGLAGALFLPVPLHRSRLVERGFNQSAVLASALARRCGGQLHTGALRRIRRTCPQVGLTRKARAANTKNAFAVSELPSDARVVLIDDVLTTGSTALECCRLLRRAGAVELTLWCFARASPPSH